MDQDPQNTSDISSQDTDKISRVTQEMLDTFADPVKKEEPKDSQEDENLQDTEENQGDVDSQEKTVVEFNEDETEEVKKPKREKKPFSFLKLCLWLIAILFVVAAAFGIWNRWFRYDDKLQLISNWQVSGTNTIVVIDGKTINLGPNAVLNYTVDEGSKIINYTIGEMKGSSHYRFSWDRNQLALIENCGTDPFSTILSDLGWFWDYMTCKMGKIDLSPAYTKNNKEEVDTQNTGLEEIISNGNSSSILLDKVSTKKSDEIQ